MGEEDGGGGRGKEVGGRKMGRRARRWGEGGIARMREGKKGQNRRGERWGEGGRGGREDDGKEKRRKRWGKWGMKRGRKRGRM